MLFRSCEVYASTREAWLQIAGGARATGGEKVSGWRLREGSVVVVRMAVVVVVAVVTAAVGVVAVAVGGGGGGGGSCRKRGNSSSSSSCSSRSTGSVGVEAVVAAAAATVAAAVQSCFSDWSMLAIGWWRDDEPRVAEQGRFAQHRADIRP